MTDLRAISDADLAAELKRRHGRQLRLDALFDAADVERAANGYGLFEQAENAAYERGFERGQEEAPDLYDEGFDDGAKEAREGLVALDDADEALMRLMGGDIREALFVLGRNLASTDPAFYPFHNLDQTVERHFRAGP
jgi:hypothetical protein